MLLVERMAERIGQYSHTRKWNVGTLLNSSHICRTPVRLPDCIILLNVMTSSLKQHPAITEAAKMAIPLIAVVDSNSGDIMIFLTLSSLTKS
jgi:small subunit ribosomal protein S2